LGFASSTQPTNWPFYRSVNDIAFKPEISRGLDEKRAVVLFHLMVKMSSYPLNGFNQKQGESWKWTSSNPIHADHSL
jgi:hypothetical protein